VVYEVEFTSKSEKQFKKLNKSIQKRLARKIDALSKNPCPNGAKKLSGEEDIYRIRVGDYRIVYGIFDTELLVLVVKIGHRRDIYR